MHDGNDDATTRRLLSASRRIALVGASARPERPSNGVMRWLIARGRQVAPVNPGLAGEEIDRRTVVASLAEVPGEIDLVDIFRCSEEAGAVVDAAIARGAKAVWLQYGAIDQAAAARSRRRACGGDGPLPGNRGPAPRRHWPCTMMPCR